MDYLLIDKITGIIVNRIIWDGVAEYNHGDEFDFKPDNGQGIGEIYAGA